MTSGKPFRILSGDGGGIRGILPAQVLKSLEAKLQRRHGPGARIADFFDLVAGTSTFGILTCMLLAPDEEGKPRFSAQDCLNLYMQQGSRIFDLGVFHRLMSAGGLLDEKYSAANLERLLGQYFGGLKVSELLKPCLITSWQLDDNKPYFFRQHRASEHPQHDFLVADAARSTSAAPTFFECAHPRTMTGVHKTLIDGGVFANNPAMCAWCEALSMGADPQSVVMLSLGTGRGRRKQIRYESAKDWGLAQWAPHIIDTLMASGMEVTDYQVAKLFGALGRSPAYLRIDGELKLGSAAMDDARPRNCAKLAEDGQRLADRHDAELEAFADLL